MRGLCRARIVVPSHKTGLIACRSHAGSENFVYDYREITVFALPFQILRLRDSLRQTTFLLSMTAIERLIKGLLIFPS